VAQLVKTPHYKPEGRDFDYRWCHNPPGCTEVDSASTKNKHQAYLLRGKGGRCVGLITLPPSCVDGLKMWVCQLPEIFTACTGAAFLYRYKQRIFSSEGGGSASHYVEASFWRRLSTCRQTEY